MNIFIGMETSGQLRRRFQALGHYVVSVDTLPAEDGATFSLDRGGHMQADVFKAWRTLYKAGIRFDAAIFHPTCTYLTSSAEWAYKDPDFKRYPGVGYHQKLKPGTLFGAERRAARVEAIRFIWKLMALKVPVKVFENPIGKMSSLAQPFHTLQVVQPYQWGDDASKGTVLMMEGLPKLVADPKKRRAGRIVEWPRGSGKMVERWANQTDSGQSNVTPKAGRWKERSRTYDGIADALVAHVVQHAA